MPADAYDAYVAAFQKYVKEGVVFSTDFLNARVANLRAESVFSRSAVLIWSAHTSDRVTGYTITRDGEIIGTTEDCRFVDRELTLGASYHYAVQGFTAEGDTTGVAALDVSTAAPHILDLRTDNSLNKLDDTHNKVYLQVANTGNLGALGDAKTIGRLYLVQGEKRSLIGESDAAQLSGSRAVYTIPWEVSTLEDGSYTLLFELTDVDGAIDTYSETVTIDRRVPAQIVGVAAIGDVQKIILTWAISAEADTVTYRVYRRAESDESFRLYAQIQGRDTLSYTDTKVKTDRVYYYYVVGVDELGREGVPSEIAGATLAADTRAPVVTKMNPANGSYLTGTVSLRLTAEDNVSVIGGAFLYSLDEGESWNTLASFGTECSASFDSTALDDSVILIKGIAYDAAGNESSGLVYTYAIDNTGPEKVKGLTGESTDVTITLKWDDVADDDIRFFRVESKNADGSYSQLRDVYSTLGVNLYNLTPDTVYTYRVVGYDTHGNRGVPSDDISVKTLVDTTAPVITRIRPLSGYYSQKIDLSITATDEHNVSAVTIQVSRDLLSWEDVYVQDYTNVSTSRTVQYTLSLASFDEGAIYVRAIAKDSAGNMSDSGMDAPYVQYLIDRTAPAAPENVKAVGGNGNIEISWVQGEEQDLNGYTVWRAVSEEGPFEAVKTELKTINWFDRNVQEGIVYYYRLTAEDLAGNQSPVSATVSAETQKDTEAPVVLAVYPESGSAIGPANSGISVTASDNHALKSILIEYSRDGETYSTLYELTNIQGYGQNTDASIPLHEFSHNDSVYLRVSAEDNSGNISEYCYAQYTVDLIAPTLRELTAVYEDETVKLDWTGDQAADLAKYKVYRKTAETGKYEYIAQISAVSGQAEYRYEDSHLPKEKTRLIYKVEAVDYCGNSSAVTAPAVEIPDRSFPVPVITCDAVMEQGVEYIVDGTESSDNSEIISYLFDFGDGTTSTDSKAVHVYEEIGLYTISLTVADDDGNESTVTREVRVKDRTQVGSVSIRVVDENGQSVIGAPVYFDLGEDTQTIRNTDTSGCATFTAEVGVHTVGCIIPDNEWLPAKTEVIITAGKESSAKITLIHQTMIEGHFEISRMTFEEIVAAGIDVSNPENQHIVRVNISLTYGESQQIATSSVVFNMTTKTTVESKPITYQDDHGKTRSVVPVVLNPGISGTGKDMAVAYLDIPVGASFLKEFFDVKLRIINNASSEFKMLDNLIELQVPEGLSIVEASGTESRAAVMIPEIAGQTTETISWILRGDKEGEYTLKADYSGTLAEFNEEITTSFVAEEPIKVYGLSAVKLIAEVNSTLYNDAFYFNLSLENTSDIDIYLPSVSVIGNVLTTYLENPAEIEEGKDPEKWNPSVRLLNTVLKNNSGFSQSIGAGTAITTLHPGETLTNKYAVYHVVGYKNMLHLKSAVSEVVKGTGIQVEIISTDMDLFPSDHALEKLHEIKGNVEKINDYYYIVSDRYFFYISESLNRNSDFWDIFGEEMYQNAKLIFNLDANYNADQTKQLTRKLVSQMLVDESLREAVNLKVDTKYLDVTNKLLGFISTAVSSGAFSETDAEAFNKLLGDANCVRGLSAELQENGLDSFTERLCEEAAALGISAVFNKDYLDNYRDNLTGLNLSSAMGEALSTACSQVADVYGTVSDVISVWNTSAELTRRLMTIAASEEEGIALLDGLLNNLDSDTAVYTEIQTIRESLDNADSEMANQFVTNYLDSVISGAAQDEVKNIMGLLDSVYGTDFVTTYATAKLLFGTLDYIFDWSGTVKDLHLLRVNATLSFALKKAVDTYGGLSADTNEKALYTMKMLKYLIKARLFGEQCFVEIENGENDDKKKDDLAWINDELNLQGDKRYQSFDDYLEDVWVRLLSYRDTLYATYSTAIDRADAPFVSLNYLTAQTNESFSAEYEYSFNGEQWFDCNGGPISVEPGAVAKSLRVRIKGNANRPTGNTAKISIPGMPRILGDVTVKYRGNQYVVEGLPAGAYQYVFLDSKNAVSFTETFEAASEPVIISETEKWTYLAVRKMATETSFESVVRYLVPIEDIPEPMLVTAQKVSLNLDGTIGINYKVSMTDSVIENENVRAVFIYKNVEYPSSIQGMVPDERGFYTFTYYVPAAEFANPVSLKFVDGENVIPFEYKGERLSNDTLKYSPQKYASSLSTESASYALVQMLNSYCYHAYVGLGKAAPDIKPKEIITEPTVSSVTAQDMYDYRNRGRGSVTGLKISKISLNLETTTEINLKMVLQDGYNIADYSFELDGAEVTPVLDGDRYVLTIRNIAAKELDRMYTLKITRGEEVLQVRTCALAYCYTILSENELAEEKLNICRSLYLYNQAANAYFEG